MITTAGVPVDEALDDIGMKSRRVVVHLECDGKESWVDSLGEVWTNQSVDQWVDWLTNPPPGEEVPNINWLIVVFPSTNINDGRTESGIK